MKQYSLTVQSRATVGRRASRNARKVGAIPAVIYGKAAPRGLMIDSKTFAKLYKEVSGITALIELSDDKGVKSLSVIQDVQRNRLTDAFNHIDFLEVKANELMQAWIKIRAIGEAIGVKTENALLEVVYPEVQVRCLPKDLPEFIEVNVEALHAGDAVFVKDLKAINGVTFVDKATQVVITCNVPEVEEEKAPETPVAGAEGAAAPADGAAAAAGAAAPAADAKAADGTKAAAPAGGATAAAKDAKAPAKK